jgi:hypothetical protein
MEAIYSSETSAEFQRITRRYIQENRTLHTEDLVSTSFYNLVTNNLLIYFSVRVHFTNQLTDFGPLCM